MDNFLYIAQQSKNISGLAKNIYGDNSTKHRELCKRLLLEHGIVYEDWKLAKRESNKKQCMLCGKELTGCQKKFCSSSCSATYNNSKRSKPRYCEYCGKQLTSQQTRFCSRQCQNTSEYETFIKRWKDGTESGITGKDGLSKYIRIYLFDKFNNRCQQCGWSVINQYTNKIPLQIHHIDGDCTNNNEENLQLLCPNCHSLTENYGNSKKHTSKRIDKRLKKNKKQM